MHYATLRVYILLHHNDCNKHYNINKTCKHVNAINTKFMLALRLHGTVLLLNIISLNFNNFNVGSYDMHQRKSITMLYSLTTLQLTDLRSELYNAIISNYKTLMP